MAKLILPQQTTWTCNKKKLDEAQQEECPSQTDNIGTFASLSLEQDFLGLQILIHKMGWVKLKIAVTNVSKLSKRDQILRGSKNMKGITKFKSWMRSW